MTEIRNILFATDLTGASNKAFSYALSLTTKYGARLDIIHVVSAMSHITDFYTPHIPMEGIEREIIDKAEEKMEALCKEHIKDDIEFVTLVKSGEPFLEILNMAETVESDLIVMGTHGRSAVDHLLFGSTAEKVVRKSMIPVLTVRA